MLQAVSRSENVLLMPGDKSNGKLIRGELVLLLFRFSSLLAFSLCHFTTLFNVCFYLLQMPVVRM